MMRSVTYQPILHTLYATLCTRMEYSLNYRIEMVQIMDERFSKRSVEHVKYVINNLLHLVTVKYGVISLILCISTCVTSKMKGTEVLTLSVHKFCRQQLHALSI